VTLDWHRARLGLLLAPEYGFKETALVRGKYDGTAARVPAGQPPFRADRGAVGAWLGIIHKATGHPLHDGVSTPGQMSREHMIGSVSALTATGPPLGGGLLARLGTTVT
jgi:hypothetical protein